MKENRVAQNNEILNNRAQCERIPHYNGENVSYTKIQPPWFRIRGVPEYYDLPPPSNVRDRNSICT
ncbi:hypothetical protein T02_13332 [Trichinella nativa]|uniref:Uncharacterized protein n=1 Tax=Trichinella nativa TaxID=6335 RepID=A0A0V1KN92_9BILA|nr:hypothetical protein T02_13332 [Trichinella nativa]